MSKRVLLGGGSGLIGQRLTSLLLDKGYEVAWLSHSGSEDEVEVIHWDPVNGFLPEEEILEADYLINLAGTGIADKRWTDARKKLIIESRTAPNEMLSDLFLREKGNVKAYISASAMGVYGDSGEDWCNEDDELEKVDFLSRSVIEWERSIRSVSDTGMRTVYLRTAMVLSTQGGALKKMLPGMKVGIAPYFGDGQQYISWIHIDDMAHMYIKAMENDWHGPYNAGSSHPLRMKKFTKELIKAHPGFQVAVPAPAFALQLAFGEMANGALLSSVRMNNRKVLNDGFEFHHNEIRKAFEDLLERSV